MKKKVPSELSFHDWLVLPARERGLTQRALADLLAMYIWEIHRYESGQSQPTLFEVERGRGDELKLQFDPEEQHVIRSVIESITLGNTMEEAERRFSAAGSRG